MLVQNKTKRKFQLQDGTWLRPNDTLKLSKKEGAALVAQYPNEIIDMDSLVAAAGGVGDGAAAEHIAALVAENTELKAQVETLTAEKAELEADLLEALDEVADVELETLTVKELQAKITAAGLEVPTGANKAELVNILATHNDSQGTKGEE